MQSFQQGCDTDCAAPANAIAVRELDQLLLMLSGDMHAMALEQ
jgi:hypothetical protein